jgi:hypothetical protein
LKNVLDRSVERPDYDREHQFDREIATAVYRRVRAAAGLGYKFQLPPSLRVAA